MKFSYYSIVSALFLITACSRQLDVDTPDFDVTTNGATFKAGQVINFSVTGNAHVISFYSGELLKEYDYRTGRTFDVSNGGLTMQFSSSVQQGTQTNQLSILASSNFNGDYGSVAKLKAATWTDITNRFTLGANATFVSSGAAPSDLSDLLVPGKPLYIAFRYITKPQAVNGLARQYFIQSFALRSKTVSFNGSPVTVADQNSIGFRIIDELKDKAPALSSVTPTRLTLYGNEYLYAGLPRYDPSNPLLDKSNPIFDPQSSQYNPLAVWQPPFDPASPYNDPMSENWAVSRPINLGTIDLGPDWSTAIKAGVAAAPITLYQYTYAKPGNYKAVFVASNNTIDGGTEVVKTIPLTITP